MNYQYSMQSMMGMPPPMASFTSMSNMNSVSAVEASQPFIGPIVPENTHQNEDMNIEDDNDDNEVQFVSSTYNEKSRSGDWDRERGMYIVSTIHTVSYVSLLTRSLLII